MRGLSLTVLALVAAGAVAAAETPAAGGKVRVLVVDGAPAFYNLHEGDPGLERELLDAFARLHKLEVVTVPVASWEALIPSLAQGKGELAAGGITDLEARRKLVDFTAEVFPTRNVVVTHRPHPAVRTLEQLRAVKVGTIRGTSLADAVAAAQVPAANVDDSLPGDGIGAALREGRVAAAVDGLEDALLLQQKDHGFEIGLALGEAQHLAFAVRRDQASLRRDLDEYLANARRSSTWSRLVVKYFGDQALAALKDSRK